MRRSPRPTKASWQVIAFVMFTMLAFFAFALNLGKIGALLGLQPSSRLAKPYTVLQESFYPTSVVWSPDGRYIADTGILTPNIHVWDMKTKHIVQELTLNGQSDGYHDMAWSPDGKYLAVGANTDSSYAGVWDTKTWQIIAKIPVVRPKELGCQSPAFSSDSQYLAIATSYNVYIFSTSNWELLTFTDFKSLPVGFAFNITQVSFKPNTDDLAIGISGYFKGDPETGHARVIFWNIHSPQPDIVGFPQGYSFIAYDIGDLSSLAYNPSSTRLATGTNNGEGYSPSVTASTRIWDPRGHALLAAPFDGQDVGVINGLAYSSDGRYLLAAHTEHGGNRFRRCTNLQGDRCTVCLRIHRRHRRQPASLNVRCNRQKQAADLVHPMKLQNFTRTEYLKHRRLMAKPCEPR